MASFDLDLFRPTDPAKMTQEVINIHVGNLTHYRNHPFKLYVGERFDDMVESIRANGVLVPLIVRPLPSTDKANLGGDNRNAYTDYDKQDCSNRAYEILSGHNRLEAGIVAELSYMPCIIKEHLSDEEAYLIVTESNLIQRSFSDLSHSERALVLAAHYDAIKKQGKRGALVAQLESELRHIDSTIENGQKSKHKNAVFDADKSHDNGISNEKYQVDTKTGNEHSRLEIAGEKYRLSKATVARYLRINKLIDPLKEKLDSHTLPVMAGVPLSYLSISEQQQVYDCITENAITVKIAHAEKLRRLSSDRKFSIPNIEKIFLGRKADSGSDGGTKSKSKKTIQVKRKALMGFFKEDEDDRTIEQTIVEALRFYFENLSQQQTH